jgi:hypothetical protein
MKVIEFDSDIFKQLRKYNLVNKYFKKKIQIEKENLKSSQFKKRRPYHQEAYYFRIDKKYRAIGKFKGDIFVVFEISKHQ